MVKSPASGTTSELTLVTASRMAVQTGQNCLLLRVVSDLE